MKNISSTCLVFVKSNSFSENLIEKKHLISTVIWFKKKRGYLEKWYFIECDLFELQLCEKISRQGYVQSDVEHRRVSGNQPGRRTNNSKLVKYGRRGNQKLRSQWLPLTPWKRAYQPMAKKTGLWEVSFYLAKPREE